MKVLRFILLLVIFLLLVEGRSRRRGGSKGISGGGGSSRGSRSRRNSRYNGYDADADGNGVGDSGSYLRLSASSSYGKMPNRGERFIGRNLPTFSETFQSNPNRPSKMGKRTLKVAPQEDFTVMGGLRKVLDNLKSTTLALLLLTVSALGFLVSKFIFHKLRRQYYKHKIMTGTNEEQLLYRRKMEQTA